jgi:hypothetical protein
MSKRERADGLDFRIFLHYRIYIRTLEPGPADDPFDVRVYAGDEVLASREVLPVEGPQAVLSAADDMFLAAHAGEFGPEATRIELLGPIQPDGRPVLLAYDVNRAI